MYTARLTKDGIYGAKYWYTNTNPFYASGYGMPNCTAYAWGRFWEISAQSGEEHVPTLPTGNGGEWWGSVGGEYQTSKDPSLGAVLCFAQPAGAGHVCIVEEIKENGDLVTSNSGYSRNPGGPSDPKFFWTETNPKSTNYRSGWEVSGGYVFQGFILNPYACMGTEDKPERKQKKFPWWLYAGRIL